MRHAIAICTLVASAILATACAFSDTPAPSIAGGYMLSSVNGSALPCCGELDSTSGARVTVLSGALYLGEARPDSFVVTPAAYFPASCVHRNPDGSGTIGGPGCGDGVFRLTITQRFDFADGSSGVRILVDTGRYAWSVRDAKIELVDAAMLGHLVYGGARSTFTLQRQSLMGSWGATYGFEPAPSIR